MISLHENRTETNSDCKAACFLILSATKCFFLLFSQSFHSYFIWAFPLPNIPSNLCTVPSNHSPYLYIIITIVTCSSVVWSSILPNRNVFSPRCHHTERCQHCRKMARNLNPAFLLLYPLYYINLLWITQSGQIFFYTKFVQDFFTTSTLYILLSKSQFLSATTDFRSSMLLFIRYIKQVPTFKFIFPLDIVI